MGHKKESNMNQQERIINFVEREGYITSLDGLKIGVTDVAGQIKAMRRKGLDWEGVWVDNEHYKKYYLKPKVDIEKQNG